MSENIYVFSAIAVMSVVTLMLRILPFLIFGEKKVPTCIEYLGKFLPYAIIGMLVIYCLKDISFMETPFGIPEFVSVGLVIILHIWKRNTLLSIVGGTGCYMLILHLIS